MKNSDDLNNQVQGSDSDQKDQKTYKYIDVADSACSLWNIPHKRLLLIQQAYKEIYGKEELTEIQAYSFLMMCLFSSPNFVGRVHPTDDDKIKNLLEYLKTAVPKAIEESLKDPDLDEQKDSKEPKPPFSHTITIFAERTIHCSSVPTGFDLEENKIVDGVNHPCIEIRIIGIRPLVKLLFKDILSGKFKTDLRDLKAKYHAPNFGEKI